MEWVWTPNYRWIQPKEKSYELCIEMGATWVNIKGYIGPNYRNRRIIGQIARLEISPCIKILTRITNVVLVTCHYCIMSRQCYPSSSDFLPLSSHPCIYQSNVCDKNHTLESYSTLFTIWSGVWLTHKLEQSWVTSKGKQVTLFADIWSNQRKTLQSIR